ncbi:MAG: hypothetical protein QXU48_02200 [Thermoplasmata archaeon]
MKDGIWRGNNLSPHFWRLYKRNRMVYAGIAWWIAIPCAVIIFMAVRSFAGLSTRDIEALVFATIASLPLAILSVYIRLKKLKWEAVRKVKITREGIVCDYDDGSLNVIRWEDIVEIRPYFPYWRKEGGDNDVAIIYRKWGYSGVAVSEEIGKDIIDEWMRYKGGLRAV